MKTLGVNLQEYVSLYFTLYLFVGLAKKVLDRLGES